MRFGHAGTIVEGKADTTADKIARMQAAGISVAERIEDIRRSCRSACEGTDAGYVHRRAGGPDGRGRRGAREEARRGLPVNIFALEKDGRLRIVEENLDECVLCELCIQAAPAGKVRVLKLYEG